MPKKIKRHLGTYRNIKFSNPYLVITILVVLGFILAANVITTKSLVAASSQNQNVLGEDNKNEGEHKEEQKKEESKSSGGEQKNEQKSQEGQRQQEEKNR